MASPQLEHGHSRIANELLEALARQPLSGQQHRILDLIFRETYGWNRKEAVLSFAEIAIRTGIDKRIVRRNIKSLINSRVLKMSLGGGGDKNVPTSKNIYIFQKDYHLWGGDKKDPRDKKDPTPQGQKSPQLYIDVKAIKDKANTLTASAPTSAADPAVGRLNKLFYELLEKKTCAKPRHNFAQSGMEFKRLLRGTDEAKITETIKNFFASTDPFILRKGYSWGMYVSNFNVLKTTGGPIHAYESERAGHHQGPAAAPGKYAHLSNG